MVRHSNGKGIDDEPSSSEVAAGEDQVMVHDEQEEESTVSPPPPRRRENEDEETTTNSFRPDVVSVAAAADATDDLELFALASTAAKDQVQSWIRSVLREVALQSLRTSMQVKKAKSTEATAEPGEQSKTSRRRFEITLTESDIRHASSCCRLVAKKWGEQLEKAGHEMVRVWIQEVVQAEIGNLFSRKQSSAGISTSNTTAVPTKVPAAAATTAAAAKATSAKSQFTSMAVSASRSATKTSYQELPVEQSEAVTEFGSSTDVDPDTAGEKAPEASRPMTAYARLRSWGAPDYYSWQKQSRNEQTDNNAHHDDDDNDDDQKIRPLEEAIAEIDELGRQGQTAWPYSWKYIEQAAAQIPHRLYNSNAKAAAAPISSQVLTHDTGSEQQQQQQSQQDALKWLVSRKRKSVDKLPPKRTKLQKLAQHQDQQRDLLEPVIERANQRRQLWSDDAKGIVPRPPSKDTGVLQWNSRDSYALLSDSEKKRLDACIHPDNPQQQPPVSVLLGSLCPVGQYHWSQQRFVDAGPDRKQKVHAEDTTTKRAGANDDADDNANEDELRRIDKEQKRERRRLRYRHRQATKQRLGDHHLANNEYGVGDRRRVSKLLQTTTTSTSLSLSTAASAEAAVTEAAAMDESSQQKDQPRQQHEQDTHGDSAHECWLDFDLGYCMLELVVNPTTGARGLYAFESLEIMALDEDDCSDNEAQEDGE